VDKEDPTKQGAGDQGMMFGYASSETLNYMPMTLDLSHKILQELADIRREGGKINYLRPDAKAQVTMRYTEAGTPLMVETVVISTQHDDFDEEGRMLETITRDMILYVIPRVLDKYPEYAKLFVSGDKGTKYHINPTGKFVIGGPHGDTGLTGRKIIVDTYGGRGAHGGGAFCFSEDTLVKTEEGYKKISLIENGDLVYTVNLESNSIELKIVREIFSKSKEDSYDLLEIELESGETIKITENHEVRTRDGWKMAKDLLEKDEILEFSDF
jgi:S-adenosylmethionine synthetase